MFFFVFLCNLKLTNAKITIALLCWNLNITCCVGDEHYLHVQDKGKRFVRHDFAFIVKHFKPNTCETIVIIQ